MSVVQCPDCTRPLADDRDYECPCGGAPCTSCDRVCWRAEHDDVCQKAPAGESLRLRAEIDRLHASAGWWGRATARALCAGRAEAERLRAELARVAPVVESAKQWRAAVARLPRPTDADVALALAVDALPATEADRG